MSWTVWKFRLRLHSQKLTMPEGARPIKAAIEDDALWLWAVVDSDRPSEERHFEVVGTGRPIHIHPVHLRHIETVLDGRMEGEVGPFVWHVFEVLTERKIRG
jgi:hypothetical protein